MMIVEHTTMLIWYQLVKGNAYLNMPNIVKAGTHPLRAGYQIDRRSSIKEISILLLKYICNVNPAINIMGIDVEKANPDRPILNMLKEIIDRIRTINAIVMDKIPKILCSPLPTNTKKLLYCPK